MAKNIKALTDDEKDWLNENYSIKYNPDVGIIVSKNGYNRRVIHDRGQSFSINSEVRKITISKDAQELWINKYLDKYTLIDVQAAISTLIVTYQDLTDDEIDSQLVRASSKIKEV